MERKKKADMVLFGTRYPPEVLSDMKQIAEQHGRSFNSEVIWALKKYIAEVKGEETASKAQKEVTFLRILFVFLSYNFSRGFPQAA